jgi:hypothetical protein
MGSGLDGVSQSMFKLTLKTFVEKGGRPRETDMGRPIGRTEKCLRVFVGFGLGLLQLEAALVVIHRSLEGRLVPQDPA